jgi:glycosyltransferase involved in cell wall biosynthesis
MKKLLFITAFPPNNKSGGQTFSLNLIKDLSTRYTVDLIYFTYKDHSIDSSLIVNSSKPFEVDNLNCLRKITAHPIFTRRFNKTILNYLANITSDYDILFFDYSQVGLYSLYLNHPYKVIRCHDILFQKFSRKDRIFKCWVTSTEQRILKSVQKIFVLSEKDADIVKSVYSLNAYFSHEYVKNFQFYEISEKKNTFVFFGVWSRRENLTGLIWFIKKVLPLINPELGIKFVIIGSGLSEGIRKKIPNNIEYLGFVDNPLDIIYKSSAVIAPLFAGAGVKVKVIDAFTTGTPVIGTDIAFEGLPFIENLMYLAHRPQEYADSITNTTELSSKEKQKNAEIFKLLYDNNHLPDQL